jgi:hypothetical protein
MAESSESIADLVRQKYDGKKYYPSLIELATVKYKDQTINLSDLIYKIKNDIPTKLPLTQIIKKRQQYQKYLQNREKKSPNQDIKLPDVKFPEIKFPEISYSNDFGNLYGNNHKNKNKWESGKDMPFNPQHS